MTSGADILNRLLSSEAKGDLLVLFHKNPGLIDTIDGVARRIGRTKSAIESDANDLLDLGVLKRKQVGKLEVIHLDHAKDSEIQETIEKHIRSLKV